MKRSIILAILFFVCSIPVLAADESVQVITNEKSHASIDLNFQAGQYGSVKKQKISNKNSWFNLNINRVTYKIYVSDTAVQNTK